MATNTRTILADIDTRLDTLNRDVLPTTPFILRLQQTQGKSLPSSSLSYHWMRGLPFHPREQELQYLSFRQLQDGLLLARGSWDDGHGSIASIEPSLRNQQRSRSNTPNPLSSAVKKKISLADYKNRDRLLPSTPKDKSQEKEPTPRSLEASQGSGQTFTLPPLLSPTLPPQIEAAMQKPRGQNSAAQVQDSPNTYSAPHGRKYLLDNNLLARYNPPDGLPAKIQHYENMADELSSGLKIEDGTIQAIEGVLCRMLAATLQEGSDDERYVHRRKAQWRSLHRSMDGKISSMDDVVLKGLLCQLAALVCEQVRQYEGSNDRCLEQAEDELWSQGYRALWHTDIQRDWPATWSHAQRPGPWKVQADDCLKTKFVLPLTRYSHPLEAVNFGLVFLEEFSGKKNIPWRTKLSL